MKNGLIKVSVLFSILTSLVLPVWAQVEFGTVRNSNSSTPAASDLRFTTYVKRAAESGMGDDVIITEAYSGTYTSGTHSVQTSNFNGLIFGYNEPSIASADTYYIYFTNVTRTESGNDSIAITTSGSQNMGATALTAGTVPAWPTIISANGGDREVALIWANAGGGVTYRVYRKHPTVNGFFKRIATGVTSPYFDTGSDIGGLTNGTTYSYVIVADNGTSQSGHSNQVSAASTAAGATGSPTVTGPPSGTVGGSITITGSNFAASNTVYINGVLQTSTWNGVSSITINASTPTGDGTLLVIRNDNSNEDGISFTVYPADSTPPTGSITSPPDGALLNTTQPVFSATASDVGSGVASVKFQYKLSSTGTYTDLSTDTSSPYQAVWGATTLADGSIYNLRIIVTDVAGNTFTSAPITITIDSIPPSAPTSISFTAVGGTVVANALNFSNINFTASANITAGQAIGGTAELLKNGASFSTPIMDNSIVAGDTIVTFDPGFINNTQVQTAFATGATLSVRLTDSAGNTSTSTIGNPVIIVDYIAPSPPVSANITVTQNAPGAADQVSGAAGAVEGGAIVRVYSDTGLTNLIGSTTAAANGSFSAISIGDNTNAVIYIVAVDAAGNPSAATSKTNDIIAPTISLGSPSASLARTGPITYTVTYTGADAVSLLSANVTLNTTGTATGEVSRSGSGTATRTVTISGITGDGTIGISIASGTASDNAGNPAPGAGPSATFAVDNTAPAITYNNPTAGGETAIYNVDPGSFIDIDFGNGGSGSTLDSAQYRIGAGAWTDIFTTDTDAYTPDWAINWAALLEGNNSISIRVADLAGNMTTHSYTAGASGFRFRKDSVAPSVNLVSSTNANGTYGAGQTIAVTVRFTESVNVTGTPQLQLETGDNRQAVYASGTGTNTLTFNYDIQVGDASSDLQYLSTSSLALNGGTIRDDAGNDAGLTLPALFSSTSLGGNKNIVINTNRVPNDPSAADLVQSKTDDTVIPAGGWIDENTLEFKFTVSDPDGGAVVPKVAFRTIGAGSWITTTGPAVSSGTVGTVTLTAQPPGDFEWRAIARDPAGLESNPVDYNGSGSTDYRLDLTPPSTPGTPTDAGQYSTSTSQIFNWTAAADAQSGITGYQLQVGTTPGGNNIYDAVVTGTSQTVTGSNGQTLFAQVRAQNGASRWSSWTIASDGITIDTEAPTMTFYPVNGAPSVSTTQNIIVTFNQAINTGTFAYTVSPDPGSRTVFWSAGNTVATIIHTTFANSTSYTVTVTAATDLAGNSFTGSNASTFTSAAPPAPVISGITWYVDDATPGDGINQNLINRNYVYGTIIITGTDFMPAGNPGDGNRDTDANNVTIGGVRVRDIVDTGGDDGIQVYTWDLTSISVGIPLSNEAGTTFTVAGDLPVVVTANSQVSNAFNIEVRPKVYSLNPTSNTVGSSVAITGTAFGNTPGIVSVSFNGTSVLASAANNTTLSVNVPDDATSGQLLVTLNGKTSNVNYDNTSTPVAFTVVPNLNITTASLPNGANGSAYSQTLSASGGTTPYLWSVSSGTLPTGLSLNSSTGVISGTPTATGTSSFTVQVQDAASRTDTQALTITIDDLTGPTMTFNPVNGAPSVSTTQNIIITFNEAVNTGTFAYTVSPDPGGRSVAWSAGNTVAVITHTAFANSTVYTVTVTAAADPAGNSFTGSNASTFTSAAPPAPVISGITWYVDDATPGDGINQNLINRNYVYGTIIITGTGFMPGDDPGDGNRDTDANNVTIGGVRVRDIVDTGGDDGIQVYTWDTTSISVGIPLSNEAGTAFVNAGDIPVVVTANGRPSTSTPFNIEVRPKVYSLNPTSNTVDSSVAITGTAFGNTPGIVSVSFNGTSVLASAANNTTLSVNVPAGATTGQLLVTLNGKTSNANYDNTSNPIAFTVIPNLDITTASLPNGTSGSAYSQTLSATGGTTPYLWSISSGTLPAGLSLNSSTGVISGTPTAAGISSFTVQVRDAASRTDTQALTITIEDLTGPTMTFNPVSGTGVSTTQNIIITFNEAVNTGTFAYTVSPDPGGRAVAWSAGNTVATITHTAFANSTSYTVTVTAAADPAGNSFTGANASIFTTAAAPAPVISSIAWDLTDGTPATPVNENALNANYVYGTIVITGTNFGADPGAGSRSSASSNVSIGGITLGETTNVAGEPGTQVYFWSNTSISVGVPRQNGASFIVAGDLPVVVTANSQASNAVNIEVRPKVYSLTPTSDSVGSPVAIAGTAFGSTPANLSVSFNGTAATPTSAGNTTLSVNVPAGATTGQLLVTINGKTSNVNYDDDRNGDSIIGNDPVTFTVQATAISNLSIQRDADAAGSAVSLSWTTTPAGAAVDIYTRSGAYSISAADWIRAADDVMTTTYTDASQVGNGTARYYKIIPGSATLADSDLTSAVVGKFDINIREGSNLISLPVIPANAAIDTVIGNQLRGGAPMAADRIYYYDASAGSFLSAYLTAGGTWAGALTSVDADRGYFVNRQSGAGAVNITVVGSVFTGASRSISLRQNSNMVGSTYPVNIPLVVSGLAGILTSGTPVSADKVYHYDNATNSWQSAYLGAGGFAGSLTGFEPGKGYYINNQALSNAPDPDTWNFTRP